MYQIFELTLGWLPPILQFPLMAAFCIVVVSVVLKVVQALFAIVSSLFGFFI